MSKKFLHTILFSCLMISILPGCMATRELAKHNYFYKDFKKEFDNFSGVSKMYQGYFIDSKNINGKQYKTYCFNTVLDGKGRSLQMDVPMDFSYYPLITEKQENKTTENIAFLLVKAHMDMECLDITEKLFFPTNPVPQSPDIVLDSIPEKEKIRTQDSITVLMIDFGNVYHRTISEICWKKQQNGSFLAERRTFFEETSTEYQKPKLKWKIRSRVIYALRHLGYILTVSIDIVTFPIQLIILRGAVK